MVLAAGLHDGQTRKVSGVPYIFHPAAVAALVAADGGSEDEIVAALLHDTIEDTEATAEGLTALFGDRVAALVVFASDTDQKPKPPWRDRKEAFLTSLSDPDTPIEALRVIAADKVHNATATLEDFRLVGAAVWDRFNAGVDEQLWYYQEAAERIAVRLDSPLAARLVAVVDTLVLEVGKAGEAETRASMRSAYVGVDYCTLHHGTRSERLGRCDRADDYQQCAFVPLVQQP